jgi:hypothetical protein
MQANSIHPKRLFLDFHPPRQRYSGGGQAGQPSAVSFQQKDIQNKELPDPASSGAENPIRGKIFRYVKNNIY